MKVSALTTLDFSWQIWGKRRMRWNYYRILSSKSVRMQNRVGPILKAVKFLAEPSAKDLHRAMENFRLKDGAIDKTAPVDFLTPDDRTAVSRDGRFSLPYP